MLVRDDKHIWYLIKLIFVTALQGWNNDFNFVVVTALEKILLRSNKSDIEAASD